MSLSRPLRRPPWLCVALAGALAVWLAIPNETSAQVPFTEEGGTLPDGTPYLMRVPQSWNGTVIRDLDFASAAQRSDETGNRSFLLERGYALIGTGRHPLRALRWDPAVEVANLERVLEMFDERFRRPDRVIQFGCSGGGAVSLNIAESYSSRIDGAIAMAAHISVWQMNTYLDGWFVLKALVAPDLTIVDLPFEASGQVAPELTEAWRAAIDGAQRTPEGRARIALAFTVGQWPAWITNLTPEPDLGDPAELEHAMYHALFQMARVPGGSGRVRKELAALGQQLSWNTGVDYRQTFENGNESFRRAVRELYREAGLDLEMDLARVDAFPRVAASPYALEWWNTLGRTATGDLSVPLLRLHEIGDALVPPSLVQGYGELIQAKGRDELYRTAYVRSASHCGYSRAEILTAFETLEHRLDKGSWASTDPEHLNALAKSLDDSPARFTAIDPYAQKKYNRAWDPAR